MLEFKKIELADKPTFQKYLSQSNYNGSEYCFSTSFMWQSVFKLKFAVVCETLVIFSDSEYKSFLFPAGNGDITAAVEQLIAYAEQNNFPFRFHSVEESAKELLEQLMPNRFVFEETRNYFDYIYKAESLKTLAGKKLHSKRNHVNRFKELKWSFEPITEQNIAECIEMNKKWCMQNDCSNDEGKLAESCAVRRALKHYFDLDFSGGILRVDNEVIAYSIGEKITSDTFLVHIEKAFSDIQGAYPTINQEFIKYAVGDCIYVNREDDSGSEGLRKAKLSYRPEFLLTKYNAKLKTISE